LFKGVSLKSWFPLVSNQLNNLTSNLLGCCIEEEVPEGANMKPSRESLYSFGGLFGFSFINHQKGENGYRNKGREKKQSWHLEFRAYFRPGHVDFGYTTLKEEPMVKRVLLVALSFALLVILTPTFVQAQAQPVISAPFVTVGVGNTFTIPIRITGATDLSSWQFDLAFDPTLVRANSVTEGPFLSSSGTQSTLFVPGFIDNGGAHPWGRRLVHRHFPSTFG
jgi:hypothetical protein